MTNRRNVLALSAIVLAAHLRPSFATGDCTTPTQSEAIANALLDKYAAAVNAHDTSSFAEIHTEAYIQHSGRSPSGLAAQIENFQRIFASMPDIRLHIEDRIVGGDKVVTRSTFSATHTQAIRGVPPTGKAFSFRTIDIWRVENGKFAEHWDLIDIGDVLNKLRDGK